MISGFLEYSTSTKLSIEVPPVITLASISICFNFVELRKIHTFSEPSSCVRTNLVAKDEHYSKCLKEILAMPMNELPKRTLSFSDIASHITYLDARNYIQHTISKSETRLFEIYCVEHVQTYFNSDMKCFTVNVLGDENKYITLIINDAKHRGQIFTWYYNKAILDECHLVQVYTHARDKLPYGFLVSPATTTRLLQRYPTNCSDYKNTDHKPRMKCVESCIASELTSGFLPFGTVKSEKI